MAAVVAAGIGWTTARTWGFGSVKEARRKERAIKTRAATRYCPICAKEGIGAMGKAKVETVRKEDTGWYFRHPVTQAWTGAFRSRKAAREARSIASQAAGGGADEDNDDEESTADTGGEKGVDTPVVDAVALTGITETSADATSNMETGDVAQHQEGRIMKVKFIKSAKNRKSAQIVYQAEGNPRFSIRFAKTGFKDAAAAPEFIEIENDAFAEPKPKLTAEQRKEARKNAPKLSPAEKLAKLQEKAAKLQAKIDADAAAKAAAANAAPAAS